MTSKLRFHLFTLIACLLLLALAGSAVAAGDAFELTEEINGMLDDGSDGGYYGFQLKVVDGPILADLNSSGNLLNGVWYPASTVKVVHHLHALRWAEKNGGVDALNNTDITYYDKSCSNTGDVNTIPLISALWLMMNQSDNQMTNAIQDHFGLAALNQTMHDTVGMSNFAALNHKFGCDGPKSDPPNQMTIVDIVMLYEEYLRQHLLNPTMMAQFENLMINQDNNTTFDWVIDGEANKLGMTDEQIDLFKAAFEHAYKPGSMPDTFDGTVYSSRAGFVRLPLNTCDGIELRNYVYGIFVNSANIIDSGLTWNASREMMRDEISNALATFKVISPFGCLSQTQVLQPGGGNPPLVLDLFDGAPTTFGYEPGPMVTETGRLLAVATYRTAEPPAAQLPVGKTAWIGLLDAGRETEFANGVFVDAEFSYDDADVDNVEEERLRLHRRGNVRAGRTEADSLCGNGIKYDAEANVIEADLCQAGEYALFAPSNVPTAVTLNAAATATFTHTFTAALMLLLTAATLRLYRRHAV